MKTIDVKGKAVEVDGEGYLVNVDDWNEEVGLALATMEKFELTNEHMAFIRLIREYYLEHKVIPTAKDFLNHVAEKLGEDKGNQKYFNSLFTFEPLKQCGRFAGLPMLTGCM